MGIDIEKIFEEEKKYDDKVLQSIMDLFDEEPKESISLIDKSA